MAYQTIERLLSRRGEKVALMLTIENVMGIVACAGPVFMLGEALPLLPRAGAVLCAAGLGVLVTAERRGMIVYERALWRVRGQARLLLRGRTVLPDSLPGTSASAQGHRAVARGGAVRKARARRPDSSLRNETAPRALLVRRAVRAHGESSHAHPSA